ncbi:Uncharacterised protein [Budvicia aquatica]|uniref:SnoaL-like domain-containing protein n=1 Tax=Budvicia aquatica TaxID=82979 RepID=A0A484ZXN6_9GAMM|nr:Uncharacterised protein [Budvicia aquatica]
MSFHPIRLIIQACDRAISDRDFDSLMMHYADDAALVIKPEWLSMVKENIRKAFIAISDHFSEPVGS